MDIWGTMVTGIVSGVAAGLILSGAAALFRWCINSRKDRTLNSLVDILGKAVELRNRAPSIEAGEEGAWIAEAKSLENEALAKANKLSPVTGSFIRWLDRIDPWTNDKEKYQAILSKVVERLRDILARNSVRF